MKELSPFKEFMMKEYVNFIDDSYLVKMSSSSSSVEIHWI